MLEKIGQNLNKIPRGDEFVALENGDVVLDGFHMKNVVLSNVHVVYKSGPVIMENVYFVNCTFEIVRQREGQLFAGALLSNPATTFTAS